MIERSSNSTAPEAGSSEELSWIERARRMVDYHPEASAFIKRASEHFPVGAKHTQILLRLWVEADTCDDLIFPLLNEMNIKLMDGQGELDTTRGVSTQPSALAALTEVDAEEIIYECIWSLTLASGPGVAISLSVNAEGIFGMQARGSRTAIEQRVGYPISTSALKDALVAVYVAEATSV